MSDSIPGVTRSGAFEPDPEVLKAAAEADAADEAARAAETESEALPVEKPAPAAPKRAPAAPARGALTGDVLPDEAAIALARHYWPDRQFSDAEAARQSLQGVMGGNAGRARRLAETEAALEMRERELETLRARAAVEAPAKDPAKGASVAGAVSPAASEADFVNSYMGPEKWTRFRELEAGRGLPKDANPEDGPHFALGYVFRQLDGYIAQREAQLEARLSGKLLEDVAKKYDEPLQAASIPAAQQREREQDAMFFMELKERAIDDTTGESVYPEFDDPAAAKEVLRIWVHELGRRRNEDAADRAVRVFRERFPNGMAAAEDEGEPTGRSPSKARVTDTAGRAARSAGALSGTGMPGLGLPPRMLDASDASEQKRKEAMDRRSEEKALGFRVRRSA